MKTVTLPSGECVPALGMGSWYIGDQRSTRAEEISTFQRGIDLGMRLIDTAEMYGDGASERLIGKAILGRRDKVFLVSKVYPHNATRRGAVAACERSLARLGIDCIDLYLLHWRGDVPFSETLEAFEHLQRQGKIRHWGVSNFDYGDMQELLATPGGERVAVNQVLYNLTTRGIEWDLQPGCRERGIPLMAYSPIGQARLTRDPRLLEFSRRHAMTPAQAALAWLLAKDDVIVIPKASNRAHLEENFSALAHPLDVAMLAELDALFPPPLGPSALEML